MSGNQPQGQPNPLSAFGFKPSDASNATNVNPTGGFGAFTATPSPFGGTSAGQNTATNTAAAPKAPLFGGSGFGSTQNPTQGVQQPASALGGGIFGSSGAQQAGSNPFGGTSASTPNPLFGGTSSTTSSASASGGLFGNPPSQPAQPTTTQGSSGSNNSTNIFGNEPKVPTGGLFGTSGASSTPVTNTNTQPGLSIFGASNNSNQTPNAQTAGASNTSSAPNPLFGNASSSTPAAQPSPFGNFGAKPADNSSQPSTSTAAPTTSQPLPSLFGSSNAANKPPTPVPSGNAAPSTTPSLFANLPKKPEVAPASGTTPAAPSAFSGFASFAAQKDTNKDGEKDGKAAAESAKDSSKGAVPEKESAPAPSPFAGFNLGGNKEASASKPPAASGEAGATTAAPNTSAPPVTSVPAPSMLRGKTVEDIVNRWTTELETHAREFSQFASEVAVWDRTLVENGNYISALYATVLAAESTQASLDQSLDHVEQQQRHLTATLDQYEKSASEILHGPGGIMTSTEGLGLADSERDKSYAVAANLYTQLDDLSRSLTQMVESVNGLNISPGPSRGSEDDPQDDAISTIAGILNAHLSSLQWIDGALNDMDGKVKDAERRIRDSGARGDARTEGASKSRSYGLGSSKW